MKILSGGTTTSRANLTLNNAVGLIQLLKDKAQAALDNSNLLRVYWYDGVANTYSAEHRAIMAVDDVQLRAGTINGSGQQKGVDSKIVTDLIDLAGKHAFCDAMVVTGDGDLAIGIELAQRQGARIAALGVEDTVSGVRHSQSPEITQIVDRIIHIGSAELSPLFTYTPPAPTAAIGTVAATITVEDAVDKFFASQNPPLTSATAYDQSGSNSIERSIDRAMLQFVSVLLGVSRLPDDKKTLARQHFRTLV